MACIQTLSKKFEKCVEKPTSRNERVTKQVNICKFSYKNLMIYKFFELKVTIYIFSVQKDAQNLFVKKGWQSCETVHCVQLIQKTMTTNFNCILFIYTKYSKFDKTHEDY